MFQANDFSPEMGKVRNNLEIAKKRRTKPIYWKKPIRASEQQTYVDENRIRIDSKTL